MDYAEIAAIMKALSDENRIHIISMIAKQDDICACNILDDLGINQSTLSYHMKTLCSTGLVAGRKEGKWMHYSLDRELISQVSGILNDLASQDIVCLS